MQHTLQAGIVAAIYQKQKSLNKIVFHNQLFVTYAHHNISKMVQHHFFILWIILNDISTNEIFRIYRSQIYRHKDFMRFWESNSYTKIRICIKKGTISREPITIERSRLLVWNSYVQYLQIYGNLESMCIIHHQVYILRIQWL